MLSDSWIDGGINRLDAFDKLQPVTDVPDTHPATNRGKNCCQSNGAAEAEKTHQNHFEQENTLNRELYCRPLARTLCASRIQCYVGLVLSDKLP